MGRDYESCRLPKEVTYTVIFGSKVEADLIESYDYYEDKAEGLGSEFLLAVRANLSLIERNPLHFQKVYRNRRKGNLKRFPFGIFYVVYEEEIVILAIIHLTRDPHIWKSRKK